MTPQRKTCIIGIVIMMILLLIICIIQILNNQYLQSTAFTIINLISFCVCVIGLSAFSINIYNWRPIPMEYEYQA